MGSRLARYDRLDACYRGKAVDDSNPVHPCRSKNKQTWEPFAKFRKQGFCVLVEETGNSRGRSALCLNGHRRHKSWDWQVSNLIRESGFPERGSPSNGHKRHKNGIGQDWSPNFVTFVLFVVELFSTFAGQRELSREEPGERSLAEQVRALLFCGNARFRILQKAHG